MTAKENAVRITGKWGFRVYRSTGLKAAVTALLLMASPVPALAHAEDAPVATSDILSQMFLWWNGAFKTPGAFTRENFAKFFTEDATLTLNGRVSIQGLDQWASSFQANQARGGVVEIVVPFKEVFEAGDRIYTYHVIRSRRQGKVDCMLAAGHATLRDGKIASIVLVRAPLDPAKDTLDPQCWAQ